MTMTISTLALLVFALLCFALLCFQQGTEEDEEEEKCSMAESTMHPHPRLVPCDDRAVQSTNDDATISKGSAAAIGYVEDPFVAHFLPRRPVAQPMPAMTMRADAVAALGLPIRRSPLINRGYYARMAAIRHLLRCFARCCRAPEFQVLSLGAGFDTLPFCVLGEFRKDDRGDEEEVMSMSNLTWTLIAADLERCLSFSLIVTVGPKKAHPPISLTHTYAHVYIYIYTCLFTPLLRDAEPFRPLK